MLERLRRRNGPETRQRILACVAATPSIHMNDAANQLGLAWNTVGHHARILERKGHLIKRKVGNKTQLYPVGMPPAIQNILRALRDPDCARILKEIHGALPEARGTYELSDTTGLSLKVTLKHINQLVEDELVVKIGASRPRYQSNLTPAMAVQYLGAGKAGHEDVA